MAPETSYKPFRRAFAMFAVALLAVCALGGIATFSEDSDAYSKGSQSSPLTSLNMTFADLIQSDLGPYYVKVGSSVSITGESEDAGGDGAIGVHVNSVTSGFGLSRSNGTSDQVWGGYLGQVSGTISKAGTISVELELFAEGVSGILESGTYDLTIKAVSSTTPVTSISISGSSSVNKGSTLTLTATTSPSSATDRHVTWSITSGSSYATIQSTSDTSTGGKCVIKGVSAGSVTVKATAADGSGASATKDITVNTQTYKYYLYFDANGGTGEPSRIIKTAEDKTSTFRITIPSTEPTRDGYTFRGWSTSSTASSAEYTAGDRVTIDYNDLTLYAVWQENKQTYYAYLYYNANGGSGAPSTQSDSIYASSASGSKSFTISSTKPTKSGYDFLGWSTSSNASSASYQPGGSISVSYGSSKTLYAVWKQAEYTSTLIFDANGGSGAPSKLTHTDTTTTSHTFTIPSTKPTRDGFLFKGWSDSKTASAASYQPGGSISVPYNGTKTLYAVWEQAKITITSNPALTSLKVGQAWSYTPAASVDGCAVSVSGADWLSASNGKVSGTPTKAGTYTVTITLEKDGYESATQTFTLKVYSALGFDSEPSSKGILTYVSG